MLTSSWQATVGKRIMGIYVIKQDGNKLSFWRALGRTTIGYWLSTLLFFIGYIMVAFTEKKTALHDK
jgi:uncharacterized RDD family membrane protein YckC